MESIRKLSNFNFQWTKHCTRITYTISHSLLYFSRTIIIVTCNSTKDYFSQRHKEINVNFHKNCENTGKILQISTADVILLNLTLIFLGLSLEIFFGVITDN